MENKKQMSSSNNTMTNKHYVDVQAPGRSTSVGMRLQKFPWYS